MLACVQPVAALRGTFLTWLGVSHHFVWISHTNSAWIFGDCVGVDHHGFEIWWESGFVISQGFCVYRRLQGNSWMVFRLVLQVNNVVIAGMQDLACFNNGHVVLNLSDQQTNVLWDLRLNNLCWSFWNELSSLLNPRLWHSCEFYTASGLKHRRILSSTIPHSRKVREEIAIPSVNRNCHLFLMFAWNSAVLAAHVPELLWTSV